MADASVVRYRLRRKNSTGGFDYMHIITDSSAVIRSSNESKTVEQSLSDIESSVTSITNDDLSKFSVSDEEPTDQKENDFWLGALPTT